MIQTMTCVFCKIVNKELPSEIVYEDEKILVFKDINPKAPIHFLVVPKKHISSIKDPGSENIARVLILAAKKVAEKKKIAGYKLVFNVGKEGGQIVDHLHMHFLAGKPIEIP